MLSFYVAPTLSRANECVLKGLQETRKQGRKALVLTPDRMNFRMQSYVFDVLKEKSLFDVEVNTLTRIVHQYLVKQDKEKTILSKQAGIAIVKNILVKYQDKFSCFSKALHFDGFASIAYEIICMLKSCNIEPNKVAEKTSSPLLTKKLEELAFIYTKYEEFLCEDFSDSFNRLDLYEKLITKEDFLDVDIYWVGFEDVTSKMLSILAKMARFTSVHIAVSYQKKDHCNNYMLYHNAPYLVMLDYCTTNGVPTHTIWCQENEEDRQVLARHLFGISQSQYALQHINYEILEANNLKEEVAFILRYIGLQVVKGKATYDDFALVLSSFSSYKEEVVAQAKNCQIPIYLDESIPFMQHAYVRVVFELLTMLSEGVDSLAFIDLLKHPLFHIDRPTLERWENWIKYTGYKGVSNVVLEQLAGQCDEQKIQNLYQLLSSYETKMKGENTFSEFIRLHKELLNDLEYVPFLIQKQQQLLGEGEYELARSTGQLYQKFENLWSELDKVLGASKCTLDEYMRTMRSVAYDMTISLPPVTHHSVKVYALDKSELTATKYMFFLGVNAGMFPLLQEDSAIVSDAEFEKVSYQKQLSPTIKQLNQRAKRKCLDALLLSSHTFLSYSKADSKGGNLLSATIIDQLKAILSIPVIKISPLLDLLSIVKSDDVALFEMHTFSKTLARDSLAKVITSYTGDKSSLVALSLLQDICKDRSYLSQYFDEYKREKIEEAYSLFYPKETSSVSQFERFFACPYQHFVQYGLRVKQKEDSLMTSLEFGNILHLFCMQFVEHMTRISTQHYEVSSIAKEILSHILQLPEYDRFSNDPANYFLLQSLSSEVVRIARAIYQEQQHSQFVPVVLEGSFGGETLRVKASGKQISIRGKIDRVDEYQTFYRIVDYKTGSDKFSYTDIASGKKLQLLIYVLAYGNQQAKTPVSAVYMPIKNKFDRQEDRGYAFDGMIPNNHALLLAMDDRLKEPTIASNIIQASTNDKGELAKVHDLMVSPLEVKELCEYAYKKIEEAFRSIIEGQIDPNPLVMQNKCACDYCAYLPMCKFSMMKGDQKRVVNTHTLQDLIGKEDKDETNA